MGAVGGIVAGHELIQKGLLLGFGQVLAGPQGAVAGHEDEAVVQGLFQPGSMTGFRRFFKYFPDQGRHFTPAQQSRNGLHHEGVLAEGLDFKTQPGQFRPDPVENIGFREIQLDGFRHQQPLNRPSAGMIAFFQIFEDNPFMGRMLVDNDQFFPIFTWELTENIRPVELADYPKPVGGCFC